ncbi:MAG: redoxin domain-containing protein, partial [Bacteroidota bacterium]
MKVFTFFLFILASSLLFGQQSLKTGAPIPEFNLMHLDGNHYQISNIVDGKYRLPKGFIFVFLGDSCRISRSYEKRLIAMHDKYTPKGYPVVAFSSSKDFFGLRSRAEKLGINYYYLLDRDGEAAKAFGATQTATAFVFHRDKGLLYSGAIDDDPLSLRGVTINYVEATLRAAKLKENLPFEFVAGSGCSLETGKEIVRADMPKEAPAAGSQSFSSEGKATRNQ